MTTYDSLDDLPLDAETVRLAFLLIMGRPLTPDHVAADLADTARNMAHVRRWLLRRPEFLALFRELAGLDETRLPDADGDATPLRLRGYARAADFLETFDRFFAPHLVMRATTFRKLFAHLRATRSAPYRIVECGSLRTPGNWVDGQSTFLFDQFVATHGGTVWSVDLSPEAIAAARRVCSHRTQLVLNDGERFLTHLAESAPGFEADLLYLDALDVDPADHETSAVHHRDQLEAALPLLGPGSVLCLDDTVGRDDALSGKGKLVDRRMIELGAERLFDGYQIAWVMP